MFFLQILLGYLTYKVMIMWCPFNWNARDAFFDAATCQRAQGVSAHQSGQYFNRDLMSSGLGCVEHHTKQTATTVALVSHSNGSARQRPSRWRTYVECKHFKDHPKSLDNLIQIFKTHLEKKVRTVQTNLLRGFEMVQNCKWKCI